MVGRSESEDRQGTHLLAKDAYEKPMRTQDHMKRIASHPFMGAS